jgi:hypothetical protein
MNEIQKTEGEIKVLEAKLSLLKELSKTKSPVEEAYKRVFGAYPPTDPSVHNFDDNQWFAFQKGYSCGYGDGLENSNDFAIPKKIVDKPEEKQPNPMDEVVNRLVEKHKSQKLCNMVRDKLGYSFNCCDEIVDLVEKWILDEQISSGSQNVNTELLVDGFNDCVRKMREMLR